MTRKENNSSIENKQQVNQAWEALKRHPIFQCTTNVEDTKGLG